MSRHLPMVCGRDYRSDGKQMIGDGNGVFTSQMPIARARPTEAGIDPNGAWRERWPLIAETQDAFQHVSDLARSEPVITAPSSNLRR
ncbi:MAG: hypothetical protein RR831_01170 [Stenotrophomonas sp.]